MSTRGAKIVQVTNTRNQKSEEKQRKKLEYEEIKSPNLILLEINIIY